jgi:hypothetical protein
LWEEWAAPGVKGEFGETQTSPGTSRVGTPWAARPVREPERDGVDTKYDLHYMYRRRIQMGAMFVDDRLLLIALSIGRRSEIYRS